MPTKKIRNLKNHSITATKIIDDLELDTEANSSPAYCILPNLFFESCNGAKSQLRGSRTLLSVSTWDGRNIFEVGVAEAK